MNRVRNAHLSFGQGEHICSRAPFARLEAELVMVGAAIVHSRRKEPQMIAVNAVLFILAAVVVWGLFGPYAF